MVIVLMGVSGMGKTTVGKTLAAELGWAFVEGDDFHPVANVAKMNAGTPLNDDRRHWLRALRGRVAHACERGEDVVLACSALEHDYREYLERHDPECVHDDPLHGPEELIRRRLAERPGHFMDPALLREPVRGAGAPGARSPGGHHSRGDRGRDPAQARPLTAVAGDSWASLRS